MPRLNQGDPLPDQDGDHADAELVDFSSIQKRSDDSASTHHPNIFARLRAQSLSESLDRLVYKIDGQRDRI
jgi:hypothetical protein